MPDKRGELGKFADRIRKESPLPLFPFRGSLPGEDHVTWFGDDVGEFLAFAKSVGASTIYLNDPPVPPGDEEPQLAGHEGETSYVEAAFLLDGEFHVFIQVAPWAVADVGESAAENPADLEKTVRARRAELVSGFLTEAHKESGGFDSSSFGVSESFRRYLASQLSAPSLNQHRIGIDESAAGLYALVQEMAREVQDLIRAEERARAESLVTECVAWANGLGIRNLSKSDTDAFLIERKVASGVDVRYLWTKAKLAVKVRRP